MERIAATEHDLLEYATARLRRSRACSIIGTAPHKAAVVSFTLDGIHPHDLGTILDHEGVAIRTGHHCAMPVMEFFKVPATARASLRVLQHARRSRPPGGGAGHRTGDVRLMDLKDLYRDVIVDHNRNPRNFRAMPDADRKAEGFNPLCGDRLTLYVKLEGDRIARRLVRRQRLRDLGRFRLAADRERQGPDRAPRPKSSSRRCTTC